MTETLLLGLIGGNIAASSAPLLHRLAGQHHGIEVEYRLLVPDDLGLDADALLQRCADQGFAGVNVTYPYKEALAVKVALGDPALRALGAVNTVLFTPGGLYGHNTDRSGFAAAYRARFPDRQPGPTLIAGAGGVGRAIAFALAELGAPEIRLFDRVGTQSLGLKNDLDAVHGGRPRVVVCDVPGARDDPADGLINATPVGMTGVPGSPFDDDLVAAAAWVFDAVYTPAETAFIETARRCAVDVMSGFELFLYQGIDAWKLFSGLSIPEAVLRQPLEDAVFGTAPR